MEAIVSCSGCCSLIGTILVPITQPLGGSASGSHIHTQLQGDLGGMDTLCQHRRGGARQALTSPVRVQAHRSGWVSGKMSQSSLEGDLVCGQDLSGKAGCVEWGVTSNSVQVQGDGSPMGGAASSTQWSECSQEAQWYLSRCYHTRKLPWTPTSS